MNMMEQTTAKYRTQSDIKKSIQEYDENQTAKFVKRNIKYAYPDVDYSTSTSNLREDSPYNVHNIEKVESLKNSSIFDEVTSVFPDYFDIAKNSLKLFGKRWIGQNFDGDFAKQYDISQDKQDLEDVESYMQMHKQLGILQNKLKDAQRINDINQINAIYDQIYSISDEIKRLDYYFTHEGKNHPVITEMMYDESKLDFGDYMSGLGQYTRLAARKQFEKVRPGDPFSVLDFAIATTGAAVLGQVNSIAAELTSAIPPSQYKNLLHYLDLNF